MTLKIGDEAPDFTLPKQDGSTVRLKALLQKSAVVLYFYPKDDTPGCTKEACSFRDAYEDFTRAGAEVVGISSQSTASHQSFAAKYQLPFTLVSDEGARVRKQYGVPSTLGLLPGRVTYIIDRSGIIRHIFNSQFNAQRHVTEALGIIQQLQQAGAR